MPRHEDSTMSSTSTPRPKRRRMDSIGTGIHKPFVSPLKRATGTTETSAFSPQATPPLGNSNLRNVTTPSTAPSTKPNSKDPQVLAARQAIRHLEHRVRDLRAQNAILQQATATITTSTATPARPGRLEAKWRRASQAAAEDVFSDFAARIRDNGGYAAFVKQQSEYKSFGRDGYDDYSQQQQQQQDAQGDQQDWRDEMGDVLTARGKQQRIRENEDMARRKEQEEEEQEEKELSMGIMLQVLNIPPEVIGWDENEQAWK